MIEKIVTGWRIIPNIIVLLLIFFSLLIFTEIIEINIFNLQYNTKRNIEKRARELTKDEKEEENSIEIGQYNFNLDAPEEQDKE